MAEYNTSNEDLGCKVAVVAESDEAKLTQPLVAGVSFIHPSTAAASDHAAPVTPRLSEVTALAGVAARVTNRGQINVTWSTENADYVPLSYSCDPAHEKAGTYDQ